MPKPERKEDGFAKALAVAAGRPLPLVGEGEAKLLSFFLRHGECDAEISESTISVRYSWLRRVKPSKYFISLAPGLVFQLMRLGEVQRIVDKATFRVGPGTAGKGRYVCDIERKWVQIRCEEERIVIRVRDEQKDLHEQELKYLGEVVRCARCNGELRTSLAKQCLHCGYDWH